MSKKEIEVKFKKMDEDIEFDFEVKIRVVGKVRRSRYEDKETGEELGTDVYVENEISYNEEEMRRVIDEKVAKKFGKILGAKVQCGRHGFGSHALIGFVSQFETGKYIYTFAPNNSKIVLAK